MDYAHHKSKEGGHGRFHMQTSAADEIGLIGRILAGEKELFHELIRPYERMVYLTLFSIVKNETEAEDGAQEAVISAYRHLSSFRGEAKFSTWLTTIAINEGRKRLRTGARFRSRHWNARNCGKHCGLRWQSCRTFTGKFLR